MLPRLSRDVIAVYVEATADETEVRLLKGLRKACPDLTGDRGLVKVVRVKVSKEVERLLQVTHVAQSLAEGEPGPEQIWVKIEGLARSQQGFLEPAQRAQGLTFRRQRGGVLWLLRQRQAHFGTKSKPLVLAPDENAR